MWGAIFFLSPVLAYVQYERHFPDLITSETGYDFDYENYRHLHDDDDDDCDLDPDSSEYDPTPISYQYGYKYGYDYPKSGSKSNVHDIPYRYEYDHDLDDPNHHYEFISDSNNLYPEVDDDPLFNYEYGSDFNHKDYGFDEGQAHVGAEEAKTGEKADTGHVSKHEHDVADKGTHHDSKDAGYYNAEGGQKQAHYDTDEQYDSANSGGYEFGGEKFENSKGHKKGSHTTGFHKVYSKDDYKKDHKFYDSEDKYGSNEKYGDAHAYHKSNEGQHKDGGSHDTHQREDDGAVQNYYNKGHDEANQAGKGEVGGEEAHHAHHEDYGKKGGEVGAQVSGVQDDEDGDGEFLVHVYD